MPGIYGIIGDNRKKELFNKTGLYRNHYKSEYIQPNKNTFLSTITFSFEGKKIYERNNLIIGLDGYYYTDDSIITSELEKVYHLFIKKGKKFISDLDGVFNIFIYNKKLRKLYIFNDSAGSSYLYYYWDNKQLIFASEMKSILKIIKNKTLNIKSVVEQFLFSHPLFNRTLVQEINILKPGSILELHNNKLTINRYFHITDYITQNAVDKNLNYYINKLYNIFDRVTQKFLSTDKISLPLTGGIDSRFLLHFMLKYNYNFEDIYTIGDPESEDVEIAKKICNSYKLPHRHMIRNLNFMDNIFYNNYKYSDGELPPIFNDFSKHVWENGNQYIIQYAYNDIVFGERFSFQNRFLNNKKTSDEDIKKVISIFQNISYYKIKSIFKDNKNHFTEISEELSHYLKNLDNLPLYSVFDVFSWQQHCRRWNNLGQITGRYTRRLVPSQDKNIIKFALNLPYKYRRWRYLLRKTITKKCHRLASFKREGTGVSLKYPNSIQIFAKAYRKYFKNNIFMQKSHNKKVLFYNNVVDNQINNILFSSNNHTDRIIEPSYKRAIWKKVQQGEDHTYILHNIINLEIFLREYL